MGLIGWADAPNNVAQDNDESERFGRAATSSTTGQDALYATQDNVPGRDDLEISYQDDDSANVPDKAVNSPLSEEHSHSLTYTNALIGEIRELKPMRVPQPALNEQDIEVSDEWSPLFKGGYRFGYGDGFMAVVGEPEEFKDSTKFPSYKFESDIDRRNFSEAYNAGFGDGKLAALASAGRDETCDISPFDSHAIKFLYSCAQEEPIFNATAIVLELFSVKKGVQTQGMECDPPVRYESPILDELISFAEAAARGAIEQHQKDAESPATEAED